MNAADYAAHLRAIVDQAPPLNREQRMRIGALLSPVAIPVAGRKGSQ